jgi:hypothetical protein
LTVGNGNFTQIYTINVDGTGATRATNSPTSIASFDLR